MLKKIAIAYTLVALSVAMITTFMQVQPALFFIELLTGSDNMFPLKGAILLTMLALLLPLLPILLIARLFNKGERDKMPDLHNKTGVVVKRERALPDAFYTNKVMVNGEPKSGVSNGKSTFVELAPGSYKIFVKGATNNSPVIDIVVNKEEIVHLKTGYKIAKLKNSIYLEIAG